MDDDPMSPQELMALADEIERRGLKFADVIDFKYEMPSEWEHEHIAKALREMATRRDQYESGAFV